MMSARHLAAAVVVLAVAAPTLHAEDAKQRGSGGGSSSAGSSHASHGSSGGGSSSSGYRPSGGSSSNGGYHGNSGGAPLTGAQRRHPRAGTGTGYRYGYGYGGSYYGGYYPYYYSPYYYRPYYWGYGSYPWGGLYFDSYWYGGAGAYGYGVYSGPSSGDGNGSIRLMVDKEKAKVYVDGYYAGIVDDFDGLFQRLYVTPGRHDITVKLEGYQTERFDVYVQEGSTVKIQHDMVHGSGEQTNSEYAPLDRGTRDEDRGPAPDRETRYEAPRSDDRRSTPSGQGMIQLNVRPDDASIYLDGSFAGSARELTRMQLPAGKHRVEIVRPGYRTYDHDLEVDPGQSVDLSVELDR
jgi:hypothetical protein